MMEDNNINNQDNEIYIEQECELDYADTVETLADDFGLSVDEILDLNPDLDPEGVLPTQIRIPRRVPPCPYGTFYTVRRGDTAFGLAREFNTSLAEIQRANPNVNLRFLRPGTIICVPRRRRVRPAPRRPFPGRP
jgi:LysM repeat protein